MQDLVHWDDSHVSVCVGRCVDGKVHGSVGGWVVGWAGAWRVWTHLPHVSWGVQQPVQGLVHRGDTRASRQQRDPGVVGEGVLLLHVGLDVLEAHLRSEVAKGDWSRRTVDRTNTLML